MDEAMCILRSKKNKVQDPDEAFGMTIGASLRSISNIQIQIQIQETYFKHNMEILWLHLHQII